MTIFKNILLTVCFLLVACGGSFEPKACYVTDMRTITPEEASNYVAKAFEADGRTYKWGGQSWDEGFDCSGLMLWALEKSDIADRWAYQDQAVLDVTAHNLFKYNVEIISEDEAAFGDLIFFDADGDGLQEHMSIYIEPAPEHQSYKVFDAYSVVGEVQHRIVQDFDSKIPKFARLKVAQYSCD